MSTIPDPSFWARQRVFLTGHTGFKGGWLALLLSRMGATVRGYALAPATDPSLFVAAGVADDLDSIMGDVRDPEALADAMGTFQPTIVLHLAAQPLVRYSYVAPVATYATNVMGTVHFLEAARACATVKAALIVTSDKCYENRETIWPYRETDPMGGHDPYSNSKGCTELVASAYTNSYFRNRDCGVASVRAGNVVGGGDWSLDRLFPDLAVGFSRGAAAIVRRPDAVRPWQHVLEPLSGYLLAAEKIFGRTQAAATAWNFGPSIDASVPVGRIVTLAARAWGLGASIEIRVDPQSVHEAALLTLDATKARHELGWSPVWGLDETVDRTISWYRRFYNGEDARALCMAQIDDYLVTAGRSNKEAA